MYETSARATSHPLARGRRFRHHGGLQAKRCARLYDYRLVRVVQQTGDISIATRAGVPDQLAAQRADARQATMEVSRARRCATCA